MGGVPLVAPLAYPLHEQRLPNGLRVIVSPDHGAPAVAVNLWYGVGSRDEQPGATGFAHLFEHLMFQGSAHVAGGEHLGALQAQGASVNGTTWFDRTNYYELVPVGALDLALWLEADRMESLPAALTVENLATQREVVKEEKRQRYDNVPYGDVLEHLVALTFPPDHPYGHTTIGSMSDLDAADVAAAHAFFRRHYAPDNAVLTLVGDVSAKEGVRRAREFFGHVPASGATRTTPPPPLPAMTGSPRRVVAADVPAAAVYTAWRLPARGTRAHDAADAALDVLGGGQTSRLVRRLVREDRLSSAAGASGLPLAWGTSLGFAFARSLEDTPVATLERTIAEEVERLADAGPTEEELRRVHVQFEREWLSQCARFDARADLFSAHAMLLGDPGLVNTRVTEYCSLTTVEVRDAARRYLRPDRWAVLEYTRSGEGCR